MENDIKLQFLRYGFYDGFPLVGDSYLADLFTRMQQDELTKKFCITKTMQRPDEFVSLVKHDPNIHLFIVTEDYEAKPIMPLGVFMFDGIRDRTGYVHICFFKGASAHTPLEICNHAVDFFFNKMNMFDVLFTLTFEDNRKIRVLAEAVGFKPVCVFPTGLFDATKDQYSPFILYAMENPFHKG